MTNETKKSPVEWLESRISVLIPDDIGSQLMFKSNIKKAKEMENERHERFNKFLNDEIKLGMSDKETIERVQWYYNTYFNETYGGNKWVTFYFWLVQQ